MGGLDYVKTAHTPKGMERQRQREREKFFKVCCSRSTAADSLISPPYQISRLVYVGIIQQHYILPEKAEGERGKHCSYEEGLSGWIRNRVCTTFLCRCVRSSWLSCLFLLINQRISLSFLFFFSIQNRKHIYTPHFLYLCFLSSCRRYIAPSWKEGGGGWVLCC